MKKDTISLWLKLMRFGNNMGCHQLAERSFFFRGYQFPVCARCTGVFIGEILALVCLISGCNIPWYISLLMLMPMGIDWGMQFLKVCMSDNLRRIITGTLGGFALTYVYSYVLTGLWNVIEKIF